MNLPYCDEVPYWKTSRSSPDAWIQKTVELLKKLGATDISEGFASITGMATFVLAFAFDADRFRVVWPVLPPECPRCHGNGRIEMLERHPAPDAGRHGDQSAEGYERDGGTKAADVFFK